MAHWFKYAFSILIQSLPMSLAHSETTRRYIHSIVDFQYHTAHHIQNVISLGLFLHSHPGARHFFSNLTREEMLAHVEIGETEGVLQKKETLIIKNLLRLNSIYVKDIMTPRSVLVTLSKDRTIQDVVDEYKSVPFSRIPIYEKDIDHVVGMVFRFEFLEHFGNDQMNMKLGDFAHPIHTIHQNQSVALTIDEFIKRREHMFLAVDDYGTTMGIVTLEDTIETLLGVEIMDETDDIADMRKFALERWEKKQLEIEQHKKILHKKT